VAGAAHRLYEDLWKAGIETLYDDRPDQTAGVKLNDADLLGLPLRLVVSPRNLRNSVVELKGRREAEPSLAPMDEVIDQVRQRLAAGGAGHPALSRL
jgi:prolyl-tRNA synthetase